MSQPAVAALEEATNSAWDHLRFANPRTGGSGLFASSLHIEGAFSLVVNVRPVDVLTKLEAFCLHATIGAKLVTSDRRFGAPALVDVREFVPNLEAGTHKIFIGGRRHSVPEWAEARASDLIVEDLLLLRSTSGSELIIAASQDFPGEIQLWKDINQAPDPLVELVYLRAL